MDEWRRWIKSKMDWWEKVKFVLYVQDTAREQEAYHNTVVQFLREKKSKESGQ